MNNHQNAIAIYARVSTDRQAVDMQLDELRDYVSRRGWTIYREYIDHGFSGANTKRPAFIEMMNEARKKKFDCLLVWKLDRLSRSMKDMVTTLHELGSLGIDFISYDNNLDTSSPTGKLVFHVIGAVAEFERDIIRDRVRAGLEKRQTQRQALRPSGNTSVCLRGSETSPITGLILSENRQRIRYPRINDTISVQERGNSANALT